MKNWYLQSLEEIKKNILKADPRFADNRERTALVIDRMIKKEMAR